MTVHFPGATPTAARSELLLLSAASPEALRALARRWTRYLEQEGRDQRLGDLTAAAALDQRHLARRVALVARTREEFARRLAAYAEGERPSAPCRTTPPRIAFVFSGGGSQWPTMGRQLAEHEPVFAEALGACDVLIKRQTGWSVIEEINRAPDSSRLEQADAFQTAIFSVQVALAALFRFWGIRPAVVVGHSMGEVAAAHVAGCLSLEDAVRVIVQRSLLQATCVGKGTAAALGMSFAEAEHVIAPYAKDVSIAASNGPRMTVIAGAREPLESILESLNARGVFCRLIKGAAAAPHSPEMDPLMEPLRGRLAGLAARSGKVPIFSTVDCKQSDGRHFDADYWVKNLRKPVRFAEAIRELAPEVDCFLELSGHPVLLPAIEETLAEVCAPAAASALRTLASLKRDAVERESVLVAAGALYTLGAQPDLARMFPRSEGMAGPKVPMFMPWARTSEAVGARRTERRASPPQPPLSPVHQALLALEDMQAELQRVKEAAREPVAIIGLGCRFAGGADTPDRLWTLFERGTDCVSVIAADRAGDLKSWFDPAGGPAKTSVREAAFLESWRLTDFDPQFFGISPREAASMDPQQRLLLEVSYEALEHAGICPDRLSKTRTGVFVGLCGSDYWWELSRHPTAIDMFTLTGNFHSFAAGRIAYTLDLSGPAMVFDTACSSSLVAVHQAARSLRNRECDVALAGGANVVSPFSMMFTSKMPAVAADGRTKAFDAAADGTTRGEGCGIVVLKRLSDARTAGDRILAIVRGSALNHDGRSNGLTAPSVHAQEEVIRSALADAHLSAADVEYVEAHGAGTKLGDPIEIEALKNTYGVPRADGRPCFVSAAKTMIGHTEAAAGVAGLIKAVLALQHGAVPGVLHLKELNPHIDFRGSRLSIPTTLEVWPSTDKRRAAVSAFGASGTNAHVVLEEAPVEAVTVSDEGCELNILAISARSPEALEKRIEQLVRAVQEGPERSLADCCFTSNCGRSHQPYRSAVLARTMEEALSALKGADRVGPPDRAPRVGFSFAGMAGAAHLGAALVAREPVMAETLERLEEMFQARAGVSCQVLDANAKDARASRAAEFALASAFWKLWRSFGVEPIAIHADRDGVVAAALAAGILDESAAVDHVLRAGLRGLEPHELSLEGGVLPLELGPVSRLEADVIVGVGASSDARLLTSLAPGGDACAHLLSVVASLYRKGVSIDFVGVHRSRPGRKVALPTYPFERRQHWIEVPEAVPATNTRSPAAGLTGVKVEVAGAEQSIFECALSAAFPAYLGHHRLFETAILPASAHIELMLAHGASEHPAGWILQDITFEEALALPDTGTRRLQLHVGAPEGASREVQLFAANGEGPKRDWTRHSRAILRPAVATDPEADFELLSRLRSRVAQQVPLEPWYAQLHSIGLGFGTDFRALTSVAVATDEALGEINLAAHLSTEHYTAHPVVLDACFQTAGHALGPLDTNLRLPVSIDQIRVFRPLRGHLFCHARRRCAEHRDGSSMSGGSGQVEVFDLHVFEPSGGRVAEISGVKLRSLGARQALGLSSSGLMDWLYRVGFRPCAAPTVTPSTSSSGYWLVFADEGGLGDAAALKLASTGVCFLACAGVAWKRQERRFTIRPSVPEDFRRMLQDLAQETGASCRGILHLWSLDAPHGAISQAAVEEAEARGPRSVLELLRGLGSDVLVPLLVGTQGAQAVHPGEAVRSFAGAMLWGLVRAVIAERGSSARLIDFDPASDGAAQLEQLLVELESPDAELEIAYRAGTRMVTRLQAMARSEVASTPYTWRADATYLVLGGLGGIGFEAVRRMVAGGARHVVMVGRSGPSEAIELQLASLQRKADVRFCQIDIANTDHLKAMLASLADSSHPLRGVLHSAATISDGVVTNLSWEEFAHVFAPKVRGSLNLQRALEELGLARELDFVAYFASGASVVGSAGQSNYAAANAYQDALASFLTARGQRVVSINWGAWVGVGDDEERLRNAERLGVGLIDIERGLTVLEHLLAGSPPQAAVLPFRWDSLRAIARTKAVHPMLSDLLAARSGEPSAPSGETDKKAAIRDALKRVHPEQWQQMVTDHLRDVVARALWLEASDIDPQRPLNSMGMDSLVALQIKHRIEQDLGVAVPVVDLLRGAPVERLSVLLVEALATQQQKASEPRRETLATSEAAELLHRLEELSDEEVRSQLERLLEEEPLSWAHDSG